MIDEYLTPEVRKIMTNHRLIRERMKDLYAEQYSQGYEWATNTSLTDVNPTKLGFELEGAEVFVGEIAVCFPNGKEVKISDDRAILTRKKPSKLELGAQK